MGITGLFPRDYLTIKYDPEGNERWIATYDGIGHYDDIATAIAVDTEGYPSVTGGSYGLSRALGYDYATVKYNLENGQELWVARYDGPGEGVDIANAIVLDTAGNVYVTGWSCGTGPLFVCPDYATIKYSQE